MMKNAQGSHLEQNDNVLGAERRRPPPEVNKCLLHPGRDPIHVEAFGRE